MTDRFNYIDLFSGCGGLSLGLMQAGWKGVFAIEKSEDAFKTLEYNLIDNHNHFDWPDWLPRENHEIDKVIKDYKNELASLKGKVTMVAGGPPCQGFSNAGRRRESDQRNKLVKSYIKFIKLVQPEILFFENVKGFTQAFKKNKEKGKRYANYVESALRRAGYYVKGHLINFGDFGIPQKRTRFILVGIRKDIAKQKRDAAQEFFTKISGNKQAFLINKNLTVNTKLEDAISDLLQSNGSKIYLNDRHFRVGTYGKVSSNYQVLMRQNVTQSIADSHRFANHKEATVEKFQHIIQYARKNKDIDDKIRERYNINKHTVILLDKNDKSPTITTLPDDYIHYAEPRILTVREYARIQSFPDWYEIKGKYTTGGKRRTQEVPRYTQIGNAIPPLFAEQAGLILRDLK